MADDLQTQGQSPAPSLQQPSAASHVVTFAAARSERMYPDDQPKADPEQPREQPQDSQSEGAESKESGEIQPNAAAADYQLEMPEGVQIDQELLNSAAPVLKEIGLSNEHANKLVPLVSEVQARFQRTQLDQFSAMVKSWGEEAKADRDMGGNNWTETSRLAGVALKAGGADASNHEVRELLNMSGLGNHPAMVRFFRNIGRELERVKPAGNGPRVSSRQAAIDTHQRSIYPNDLPRKF